MFSRWTELVLALLVSAAGSRLTAGETGPWLMQLQEASLLQIAREGWKNIIIDYSKDGTDSARYPAEAVQSLRKDGGQVLCYISVGEAESYRFYWKSSWSVDPPPWLGHANKDWPGNFKVRYWDPGWRDTVLKPYLDRILKQGFDGLYLDVVDAFEYWTDKDTFRSGGETHREGDPRSEKEAARRMVDLIQWIAANTRDDGARKEFRIVPQNGERLFDLDDDDGRLTRTVSGIGIEDLWYDGTIRREAAETSQRLKILRRLKQAGKFICIIDYVDDGSGFDGPNAARIQDFRRHCSDEGFGFYVAPKNRKLDHTHPLAGIQP